MLQLDYSVIPTFAQVHQDDNKYLFIRGPVGSGKSSGCIWQCFLTAMNQTPASDGVRRTKFGILRASYPALKSTVIKSWKDWFKDLLTIVYDIPIRGSLRLPHPDGETTIEMDLVFIALDREEDVNKLQSLELTAAHVNEAHEMPPGVIQMLKSRVNRFPAIRDGGADKSFIILDYNAVHTQHWLYTLAEEDKPPKHSFYVQPPAMLQAPKGSTEIYDTAGNYYTINPYAENIENLAADYYPDMILGADTDWVNVFVLNNYGDVRSGRPVYKDYYDHLHHADRLIKPLFGVPLIIGMDLGLMPAAAFMQLAPTGKLNVIDEIVTDDCSIQEMCKDYLWPIIKNKYAKYSFHLVIDPSATKRAETDKRSARKIIHDSGLPYRLARTQEPLARRESVIRFLRKINGFSLSPNCIHLRKGFISEYKYEKRLLSNVESMFKEKPEKNLYSHIHEGLQYGALELGEGRAMRSTGKPSQYDKYNQPASIAGY